LDGKIRNELEPAMEFIRELGKQKGLIPVTE
jgi:hypothetical protein